MHICPKKFLNMVETPQRCIQWYWYYHPNLYIRTEESPYTQQGFPNQTHEGSTAFHLNL